MKQTERQPSSQPSGPLRIVMAGWAGVLVFALTIFIARGTDEAQGVLMFSVIALVMAAWVWLRRSRAALITSLVLGVLHTLEQVAYLTAVITGGQGIALLLGDLFGLAAGVCIIVGSALALAARRHVQSEARIGASLPPN